MIRIAVAGAGFMARRRSLALLATGRAEICGVAARRRSSARRLAEEVGCPLWLDSVHRLLDAHPDAVLVEVPNAEQDAIVLRALDAGLPVLIGGPLSTSVAGGRRILEAARRSRLVVEAGFEARYKPAWEEVVALVGGGAIGRVIAVRTVALWACDPSTWYARESRSGGMPVAHMTYAFVNPLRWLLGEPTLVSAFANRVANTAPGAVAEETCVASLRFPHSVLCSMTAGFVKAFERESWSVWVIGTDGGIELLPTELDAGTLVLHRGAGTDVRDFGAGADPFVAQADAFLDSLMGERRCRNPPDVALGDLRVAAAIARSVRSEATVRLTPARSARAPEAARTRSGPARPARSAPTTDR